MRQHTTMKITFEPTTKHEYTSCSVSTENDDLTLDYMIENLVIPALLGIGFSQVSIDEYFDRDFKLDTVINDE